MNTDHPASYGASTVEEIHLNILSGYIDKVAECKTLRKKNTIFQQKSTNFLLMHLRRGRGSNLTLWSVNTTIVA